MIVGQQRTVKARVAVSLSDLLGPSSVLYVRELLLHMHECELVECKVIADCTTARGRVITRPQDSEGKHASMAQQDSENKRPRWQNIESKQTGATWQKQDSTRVGELQCKRDSRREMV